MSTSRPASSPFMLQFEQARQTFHHQHAHLGQEKCDQLWELKEVEVLASLSTDNANAAHKPRTQATQNLQLGGRTTTGRRSSAPSMHGQHNQLNKRTPLESTAPERRALVLNSSMEIQAQEYEPSWFVASNAFNNSESMYDNTCGQSAALHSAPRLSMPCMPSGTPCDLINECSLPNTPLSMTNASTYDGTMSRTASLGGFEMLRINSTSSISNAEELSFSGYPISSAKSNDLADTARSHLVRDVGFGSLCGGDALSSVHTYPMSTTSSLQSQQGHSQLGSIAEVHEATSVGMYSNMFPIDGIASQQYLATSQHSRQQGMSQHPHNLEQSSHPTNQATQHVPQLLDIRSADGQSTRAVASIPRTTYKRPTKEKQYCQKCDDHPEGFRGDHELTRHMQRQHSTMRKCWIAVDKSEDGKWLSNCKHCRNKKKYYAYYNLAAHLRRIHFNKKEKTGRGRRRRGAPIPECEKKGGKSGGDSPSIEWLKEHGWIIEVDEYVSTDSPEPVDNMDDEEDTSFDDYALQFGQRIDNLNADYRPAFPDNNWQPSLGNIDLTAQPFSTNDLAMTPHPNNYLNSYITADGTAYGQDSYSNFQSLQQVDPTAIFSQVYMQH